MNEILPQILRIYQRIGKNVFHWEKWHFEPIANSVYTEELLAFGKNINIWCFTQADNMWNENTSSIKLHSVMNLWWAGSWIYVKFNDLSVTRNAFGFVLKCFWVILFVRGSKWDQVIEINFSSVNLDSCWKLFGFLPASWVMYSEDTLLI